MRASEARKIADENGKEGLENLFSYIRRAAERGETSISTSTRQVSGKPEKIVRELILLGYKAEFVSDQRDGSYYHISW